MARKTYSDEEIQKRIDQLSEEAADFLYSPDMGVLVKHISDAHKLHIDQMSLLEAEVGELMLGLTEPMEFVPNLMDTLHIDKETADAVAKDVNDQLMQKMRGLMGAPSAQTESSIVMPSSKPIETPPAPVAIRTPAPAAPIVPPVAQTPAVAPKPALDLHAADAMLSQKQVSTSASATVPPPAAPAAAPAPAKPAPSPAQPQNYKADPYREPVE